ncbi:MAG: energy transducer TonB [Maricaulaceae bacterium]
MRLNNSHIQRWIAAITTAILLFAVGLYFCSIIFFNLHESTPPSSQPRAQQADRFDVTFVEEHSFLYQITVDGHEHSKQIKDAETRPNIPRVVSDPIFIPPTHETKHTAQKPGFLAKPIKINYTTTEHACSTHVVRFPPMMPTGAEKSGHCKVRFDVTADGTTQNIQILFCTQEIFNPTALESVSKWRYPPEDKCGNSKKSSSIKTTIRYKLIDENGNIIPE